MPAGAVNNTVSPQHTIVFLYIICIYFLNRICNLSDSIILLQFDLFMIWFQYFFAICFILYESYLRFSLSSDF